MSFETDFKSKALGFAITGFSVIVGMSYNETLKTIINRFFPLNSDVIAARILYSLVLTLLLVILIDYIQRLDNEAQKKKPPVRNTYNQWVS